MISLKFFLSKYEHCHFDNAHQERYEIKKKNK